MTFLHRLEKIIFNNKIVDSFTEIKKLSKLLQYPKNGAILHTLILLMKMSGRESTHFRVRHTRIHTRFRSAEWY